MHLKCKHADKLKVTYQIRVKGARDLRTFE